MQAIKQDVRTPDWAAPLYLRGRYRNKVMHGGRGSAKSWAVADYIIHRMDEAETRVLCTREKQNSIKQSVHQLLVSAIKRNGYTDFIITDQEIRHRNGSAAFFMGLWNNIDSIKSVEGVDICWVEEASSVSQDSLDKLTPTIRKPGSEVLITFNPEYKTDAVYQRFVLNPTEDDWVVRVSWRDNPWFSDELRREMLHTKSIDNEKYLHVWEGELKQFGDGSIYRRQLRQAYDEGRVCKIPIVTGSEVHTFWDLGRDDATSICFAQQVGREMRFIDYYENAGNDLEFYARVLKERDYNYGTHYLPHDVGVTDLSSNRGSRQDILESVGVRPIVRVPRINNIQTGIEMTRQFFSQCYFDVDRCERLLEALAAYEYEYKESIQARSMTPRHSWASHGADAFRQAAQGWNHRPSNSNRKPVNFNRARKNRGRFE